MAVRTEGWPCSGDGGDQHLPAGFGQPGADSPVVDVAAGGLGGIVETRGDYYVDPHDVPALPIAAELNHTCR
jgi:hypothetical protein